MSQEAGKQEITPMGWYDQTVCEYCVRTDTVNRPCAELSICVAIKHLQATIHLDETLKRLFAYFSLNQATMTFPPNPDVPNIIPPYDPKTKQPLLLSQTPLPQTSQKNPTVETTVNPLQPQVIVQKVATKGNAPLFVEGGIAWRDDITNESKKPCQKAWYVDNKNNPAYTALLDDINKKKAAGGEFYENQKFYWVVKGVGHPVYIGRVLCKPRNGV